MTKKISPTIALSTQSTGLPISWDIVTGEKAQPLANEDNPLILFTGKRGELLINVQNHGDCSIDIDIETIQSDLVNTWLLNYKNDAVEGNKPPSTKKIISSKRLEGHERIREILNFEAPLDFFEDSNLFRGKEKFDLHYQIEIHIYATPLNKSQRFLVGHKVTDLYIQPNRSYINFLPEIYQRSDFLNRYMAIFEKSFDPTVQILDDFWAYLDPLTAPKGLIPFLAEWVAWPMNPQWPLKLQRWLIRHAVELYRWRGTRYGLQLAISLVSGLPNDKQNIKVREEYEADFVLGEVSFADEPTLGSGRAFHFSVTLCPDTIEAHRAINESIVREIIEREKPAFCTYDITIQRRF